MSFRLKGVLLFRVPAPEVVFELSNHRVESVADCHVEVLMGMVRGMLAIDDQLVTRDVDVHADSVEFTLLVMIVRRLDHDMTAGDVLVEPLESTCLLADPLFDSRGYHRGEVYPMPVFPGSASDWTIGIGLGPRIFPSGTSRGPVSARRSSVRASSVCRWTQRRCK